MPSSVFGRNDRSVRVSVARFRLLMLALAVPLAASAQVPLSNVASIDAGYGYTCAVTQAGDVACSGGPVGGGIPDYAARRPIAFGVPGLSTGVVAVTAGWWNHRCVVTSGGGAKCWGQNARGQLGNGSLGDAPSPVDVSGLTSAVSAISAGEVHTCALTTGGAVKCWGANNRGQLGVDDALRLESQTPLDVAGLSSGVSAIAVGTEHSCALTASGGVKCWGRNNQRQLGDGTQDFVTYAPNDVVGLSSGISAIAAGRGHTCALTDAGTIKCWGDDSDGQLGRAAGDTTDAAVPGDVAGLTDIAAIALGDAHTCALTHAGGVKCWGSNFYGQGGFNGGSVLRTAAPMDVIGLQNGVAAIAAGHWHTCALKTDGAVTCWGMNESGQLGDTTYINRAVPVTAYRAFPPAAPIIGTAVAVAGAADVPFGEPADGGFPILSYTATSSPDDRMGTCSASPCTVEGLVNGVTYTFTVTASNELGAGPPSAVSNAVTPRADQTINFLIPDSRTYGEPPFTLVAFPGLSGNPVILASQTPATCLTGGTNGATVSIVAVGVCVVRASQAGSAAYNAAPDVERNFLIEPASQTLTVPAAIAPVVSGQTASFLVTGGGSGNPVLFASQTPEHCSVQGQDTALVTAIGAGTCVVEATQTGDDNHLPATPRRVNVTVTNAAPDAVADAFAKTAALSITGNVLVNDIDPGNDRLTASVDVQPLHGTLSMNSSGDFNYRPSAGYVGADSFAYTATDPYGASDSAIVSLDASVSNAERIAVAGGVPIVDIASLWSGEFAVATSGAQYYRLRADLSVKHAISTGATLDSVGLIADGTAFLAAENTFLYAFSPLGVSLDHWPRAVGSRVAQSMAATDAGTVFVCPRNGIVQVIDRENRIQGSTLLGDDCAAAPLLLPDADAGVVVSIAGDGAVFSLSGFTGGELDVVRRFFLPSPPATPLSAVDGSTFVWIDQAGYLRKADAVDASDATASAGTVGLQPVGDVLTRDDGSLVFAGAAAAQGRACLYSAALAPVWCATLEAPVAGTGVLGRPGEVYFPLATGRIVRIDLDTGDLTAAVQATDAGAIASDLLFDGARIYAGDTSGSIARVLVTDFDALAAGSAAKHASKAMVPQGYWTGAMGGRMRNGRASAAQFGAAMIFGGNFE